MTKNKKGWIHRFSCNGYLMVLDVPSGSVHVVDSLCYDLLGELEPPFDENCPEELFEKFPKYSPSEIKLCYQEIYQLVQEGLLFSEDIYREYAEKFTLSPIKSLCLNVAHDCNLRCKYCFASTGDFGAGRKLMTAETGERAIDFLISHSGNRRNLELDFFGGEPLMNFPVVEHVVDYARKLEKKYNKNFRFTITTNGVLLDDKKIEFLNREMHNIVLSLDGRHEVNSAMRPRADGSDVYEKIVSSYQKLVEGRGDKDYYLRGTFTKLNLDFSKDVLHMADLGFEQLSVEPVVADPNEEYALSEEDLPVIFEEYERLARELLDRRKAGKPVNFFHFMIDLDQGPCAIKRLRGCSCGNEYVAVTPDGDIYPCHQFVGKEDWKLGTLEKGITYPERRSPFLKTTVFDKENCTSCWARYYCSGGCNANNLEYGGAILKPYTLGCELEKKRLECAIMMQAALRKE